MRGIDLVCLGVQQEGLKGVVGSVLGLGQYPVVSGEEAVWPVFLWRRWRGSEAGIQDEGAGMWPSANS